MKGRRIICWAKAHFWINSLGYSTFLDQFAGSQHISHRAENTLRPFTEAINDQSLSQNIRQVRSTSCGTTIQRLLQLGGQLRKHIKLHIVCIKELTDWITSWTLVLVFNLARQKKFPSSWASWETPTSVHDLECFLARCSEYVGKEDTKESRG